MIGKMWLAVSLCRPDYFSPKEDDVDGGVTRRLLNVDEKVIEFSEL